MLTSLHVENAAVIRSADLDFDGGFTAMTGETGAGKSVILSCLGLLLGAKANGEIVRTGEESAMVSGLFADLSDTSLAALREAGVAPDEEGKLLIQRTVTKEGKSQMKINGRQVSLAVLRTVGASLVSVHGQNESHTLTDPASHLHILDLYAQSGALLEEYAAAFEKLEAVRREIREVSEKQTERERLSEILKYQIADIDALALRSGEEEILLDQKLKIRSSERIAKQAGFVYKALKGSEKGSVAFLLDRSAQALTSLSDVLPKFAEYAEKLRDMLYTSEDIAEEVLAALDDAEEDPEESLNKIEERLEGISKLKRKYGLTVDAVLAFREKAAEELETIENSDELLKKLQAQEKEAYGQAKALADRLHEKRSEAAEILRKNIVDTLCYLDMPKAVFFASIRQDYENGNLILKKDGADRAEFFLSTNLGQDPQPLARIASGGEIARVMLAVRSAIADKDGISTVVFDEIDSGVSGKTARKIGIRMLEAAQNMQIITVTHSAQIASLSDRHLFISKSNETGKTETRVKVLDEEGRITELSRILGGLSVTEAQKNAARDMLKERADYLPKRA